jgi:hypothetical protein
MQHKRETKTHWRGKSPAGGRIKHNGKTITLHRTLCGLMWGSFANKKRAVTCLRCQKILAGYQGEVK